MLCELGFHEQAVAELRQALGSGPDLQQLYWAKLFQGRAEEEIGNQKEAALHFQKAATLYPRAHSPRLALSVLSWQSGDRMGALRAIQVVAEFSTSPVETDPWWSHYEYDEDTRRARHRDPKGHSRGAPMVMKSVAVSLIMLSASAVMNGVKQDSPISKPAFTPTASIQLKAATARIQGRVVAADTGLAMNGALVQVNGTDLLRTTRTDSNGLYRFDALRAGRYNVSVSKPGYVTLQFGQRTPFEQFQPVDVAEGQLIEHVNVSLPRGGVITGRVWDPFGDPVAGVRVNAHRFRYAPDGRRYVASGGLGQTYGPAVSDDRGVYRVYGLMPDKYVVVATPADEHLTVVSDIGGERKESWAATYHPDTVVPDEARAVTVTSGQETSADVALVATTMFHVSGVVHDSHGRPLTNATLALRSTDGRPGDRHRFAQLHTDGRFTVFGVLPGEYVLDVQGTAPSDKTPHEFASVPVTVRTEDVDDLIIPTGAGATIRGRVIFEGGRPSDGGEPLRMSVAPTGSAAATIVSVADGGAVIDRTGAFEIRGVAGNVLFRAASLPNGWTYKRIMLRGRDVTDVPVELASTDDLDGLEVVLTPRLTTVNGTVTTPDGREAPDVVVVVLPRQRRNDFSPLRFVATKKTDRQGSYEVHGLPASNYVAIAVDYIDEYDLWDPSFQDYVLAHGQAFQLLEGTQLMLNLQLLNAR